LTIHHQIVEKPFEIFEEDFLKTAIDYLMFQNDINSKEFGDKLLNATMYQSQIDAKEHTITITLKKSGVSNDTD
jgi:hypothetical protein